MKRQLWTGLSDSDTVTVGGIRGCTRQLGFDVKKTEIYVCWDSKRSDIKNRFKLTRKNRYIFMVNSSDRYSWPEPLTLQKQCRE